MLSNTALFAQATIKGKVSADGMPLPLANVILKTLKKTTVSDSNGNFIIKNVAIRTYEIHISHTGFKPQTKNFTVNDSTEVNLSFDLKENNTLDEVVLQEP